MKAEKLFEKVNHMVGRALCQKELSLIFDKFRMKKESGTASREYLKLMKKYITYKLKKHCPYTSRIHGHEISLMSEVVSDNELRDLFPSAKAVAEKLKSKNTGKSPQKI